MISLAFERRGQTIDGRSVRRAIFERRSALSVSAACVVANGVRETLSALLAIPVLLRLSEPAIPDAAAWQAISAQAHMYRVCGSAADAAFVLRPRDALALAAAAFGETEREPRPLSPVENEVVVRAVRALAGCLAPICGRDPARIEPILDITGYATYFELLVERPAAIRIGIALSKEPVTRGAASMSIEQLLDVEIELSAEFATGAIPAAAILDLRPGAVVPMITKIGQSGLLRAGGTVLARGECGTLGERNALIVGTAP
jgi:flagellar motor switch/type III secretory pathway protein FliN